MNMTPCFGVNCESHGQCQRYHAVDFSDPHSLRYGHCPTKDGRRTLFVPMFISRPVEAALKDRRAA